MLKIIVKMLELSVEVCYLIYFCTVAFSLSFFSVACEDGYVRLVDDVDDVLDSIFIKDTLSRGRVEICINRTFHGICEENWDNTDASVLCSELGFSSYG